MRRSVVCLALLVIAVAFASPALAQEEEGRVYKWFVAPELSFVISPEVATDYYSMGFGLSAGMEYPVGPNWSIVGWLNYVTFSPDEGVIAEWWDDPGEYPGSSNISVSEGALTAFTIGLQGKGSLKKPTSKSWPYAKGGFGLTFAGAEEARVDFTNSVGESQTEYVAGADDNTNISILLAVGFEFASKGTMSFFGEIGYEVVMIDEDNNAGIIPIRLGINF